MSTLVLKTESPKAAAVAFSEHDCAKVTPVLQPTTPYEALEKSIPTSISTSFKSELGNLKERRNSLAHTYYRGVTLHYDAPPITISRYQTVAAGLNAYDKALRAYC